MILLRDLLNEDKKLRIFDFDDTLVKTKSFHADNFGKNLIRI